MVCAEIRKKYGVPVESLRFVRNFMAQEGANHFRAAAELMATLGVPILLLTDLKKTFVLDSDIEFANLMSHGFLSGDKQPAYILLKVNHLVNRLLGCLKEPIHLPEHGKGYEVMARVYKQRTAQDAQERKVLQLIRDRSFRKVEVAMHDGTIRRVTGEQDLDPSVLDDLSSILSEGRYQTLELTQQDGRIVHVSRKTPHKFDNEKTTPSDGDKPRKSGGKK
ncbi:MAG: hypothetical protein GY811_09140 [Myxococcales bacterium]|nr:hypothetical protein [Myxococcales bacterium]